MTDLIQSFNLTPAQWAVAILSGLLVGIAKTGISGAGMLAIPLLAAIFGGKTSAGLLLPMLCAGDIAGVAYYHSHASWHHLRRLLPWALAGILLGVYVGGIITDRQFRLIMGFAVLGGITIMIWRERFNNGEIISDRRWFAALMGLLGGFTSMIGNAAVPVVALYFLSMQIPKFTYIGTWAWFFLIVNCAKVPLHAFVWGTITPRSLAFDALMLPAIAVGAVIGIIILRLIPEKVYRIAIIIMTVIAAFKLFF